MEITEQTVADARALLQRDILVLMERFEASGMDSLMEDDYLYLYTLYQRAQSVE